ncbi:MAG: ATP-dependent DNA helicase RecG [Gammaproteobacteria bacterium]|nr:ATP-dependent DNA helicase RecG [Gammaproteobacteria bacterium]
MKLETLLQPVATLPGIGERTALRLAKLGIVTCQDLLFHLPIRYENKTSLSAISELTAGATAHIQGAIEFIEVLPRGRRSLMCRINDGTGFIDLRFFHFTARQYDAFKTGVLMRCYGLIRFGYAGLEMVHPDYAIINNPAAQALDNQLTPVYPLTEGIQQNTLRKGIKLLLTACRQNPQLLIDYLPANILAQYGFPSLIDAIGILHAPAPDIAIDDLHNGSSPALKRLVFEEFLAHHLGLKLAKKKTLAWQAPRLIINDQIKTDFINSLPFQLTAAQHRVMAEVAADCSQKHPMMRLLQGDVGCGKTVVAAFAAFLALNSGYQCAVMAPTELLAEQHFRNFSTWFNQLNATIALLTSQIKGNARKTNLQAIQDGSVQLIIGTHALFQDEVAFHRLGLIIIDEQHRFGVHQRLALKAKGQRNGLHPHQLVMTATPIPRTLAMLQYSDIAVSIINELPPGRLPVTTSVIPNDKRMNVIQRIESWINNNRQAYWICTLIEESEMLQYEAAEKTAATLAAELPNTRVGLLHGRLKPADKDAVMLAFKNGDIDLLVATTVIEVGVDVPNASLMIIENPERLGLSQLHQLRGRVGRGGNESFCLLLYQSPLTENARQRLGIMRDTNDGFVIAEKDLLLRGPGEVMGVRQTGQIQFKIADLVRDAEILDNIPDLADALFTGHPAAVQPLIQRWLGQQTDFSEV